MYSNLQMHVRQLADACTPQMHVLQRCMYSSVATIVKHRTECECHGHRLSLYRHVRGGSAVPCTTPAMSCRGLCTFPSTKSKKLDLMEQRNELRNASNEQIASLCAKGPPGQKYSWSASSVDCVKKPCFTSGCPSCRAAAAAPRK